MKPPPQPISSNLPLGNVIKGVSSNGTKTNGFRQPNRKESERGKLKLGFSEMLKRMDM
jgi:hypothetical protein